MKSQAKTKHVFIQEVIIYILDRYYDLLLTGIKTILDYKLKVGTGM